MSNIARAHRSNLRLYLRAPVRSVHRRPRVAGESTIAAAAATCYVRPRTTIIIIVAERRRAASEPCEGVAGRRRAVREGSGAGYGKEAVVPKAPRSAAVGGARAGVGDACVRRRYVGGGGGGGGRRRGPAAHREFLPASVPPCFALDARDHSPVRTPPPRRTDDCTPFRAARNDSTSAPPASFAHRRKRRSPAAC